MALALLTNAVLDVTFGVAFWTAKKAGQGIYYIGSYFLRNDDDGNGNNDGNNNGNGNNDGNNGNNGNGNNDDGYQVNNPSNNVILMEEIGKLREEIKDLKESINQ